MSETKVCTKCGESKDIAEFYRHPAMKDGYLNECKECKRAASRQNYIRHIEQYRMYERGRFKRPERMEQRRRYARNRHVTCKEKCAAHNATSNAIRDGRLIRQQCESCGSDDRVQAHHWDYSKPLDVVWLCFVCHRKEHGQLSYMEADAKRTA